MKKNNFNGGAYNTNSGTNPRKSNGNSIDNNKFRKSTTGANNNITNSSGNRNVLTRNLNYNKSVI